MLNKKKLTKLCNDAKKVYAFLISFDLPNDKCILKDDGILKIYIGSDLKPINDAQDGFPISSLAKWFAYNWWRLNHEEKIPTDKECRSNAVLDWEQSHRMTAVGEGCLWPDLAFIPKQDTMVIVDYSHELSWKIKKREFKLAVVDFVNKVIKRIPDHALMHSDLYDMWVDIQVDGADEQMFKSFIKEAKAHRDPWK